MLLILKGVFKLKKLIKEIKIDYISIDYICNSMIDATHFLNQIF